MDKKIIAVMGATGHVGSIIADDLLKRGHVIRAIGRNEKKLRTFLGKGAEIFLLEFDDVSGLEEAFKDCFSVFCMIPPALKEDTSIFQDRVGEAICQALQQANVNRVVNLSSLGAEFEKGMGVITGLHRQEDRLNSIDSIKDLIHLRAGYFMENFSSFIPTILYQDEISCTISGDLLIPMVATRDIGWKAADFLDRTDPIDHLVFDFVGPREISLNEATNVLAHAFDKPNLIYVQNTFEDERDKLLKMDFNPKAADLILEMFRAFNEGKFKPTQKLTPEHRGTTTIEEFAIMFVHRWMTLARG